jgi:hypothetical protein
MIFTWPIKFVTYSVIFILMDDIVFFSQQDFKITLKVSKNWILNFKKQGVVIMNEDSNELRNKYKK